jgi:hypothetical protein
VIYEDLIVLVRIVRWRRLVWTGHTPRRKVGASKEHNIKMRRQRKILTCLSGTKMLKK